MSQKILIAICTCQNNVEQRSAVRNTWLSELPDNVSGYFFLGKDRYANPLPDEVHLPVPDTYEKLTTKVRTAFKHFLKYSDFDWLFKCDDDTYVRANLLHSIIPYEGVDMVGNDYLDSWSRFASGGAGYLLSRKAVELIVANDELNKYDAEDVGITQEIVRNLKWESSPKLIPDAHPRPNPSNSLVTCHHITAQDMYNIHHELITGVEQGAKILEHGQWYGNVDDQHIFDVNLAEEIVHLLNAHGISDAMDLGCGYGRYVRYLKWRGFHCQGYDGHPETVERSGGDASVMDIAVPITNLDRVPAVISLEVGEHIPGEYEETYLSNLAGLCSNLLIISWALPGQGGYGHVNCRSNEYVTNQMNLRGFIRRTELEYNLRRNSKFHWFKNTIMVFQRDEE